MPEAMALALVVMVFIPTIAWVCDRAASRVASARAEERKRSEEERAMLGRQRSGVLDMREKWIAQRESVVWDREKQLARQVSGAQSEVVERALGMASALADPKVVMRRDRTSASPSRVTIFTGSPPRSSPSHSEKSSLLLPLTLPPLLPEVSLRL